MSASSGNGGTRLQLEIPPVMESVLRPHQIAALHFIWKRLVVDGALRTAARTFSSTIEQRTRLYQEISGVILGHSMGLGKTVTSLTFVLLLQAQISLMIMKRERARLEKQQGGWGLIAASSLRTTHAASLRVLVLCPRSCVLHWQNSIMEWVQPRYAGAMELQMHIPSAMGVTASSSSRNGGRALEEVLLAYYREGGVLLLGYEEYQRLLHYAQTHQRTYPSSTFPRILSQLDKVRLPLPLAPEVRLLDMLQAADLVILDEAHRLRRSNSQLVTALIQHLCNVQLRLALTGTPLQNHLEEYNTMQSIVTGRELDAQLFSKHFIAPIELGQCADASYAQFVEMQRCVASLRNYFVDSTHHCGPEVLAATLPPRREFLFFFTLSAEQEVAYKAMLQQSTQHLQSSDRADSVLRLHHIASHICLHPGLAPQQQLSDGGKDEVEDGAEESTNPASPVLPAATLQSLDLSGAPKLSFAVNLTLHIVQQLHEKVVIFSQYLSHLRLIGALLAHHGINAPALTGSATDAERRRCIDDVQHRTSCQVLLCSVRAGGVGIKLTAANHCILLDVSWNPADDLQATYRLYRYGQQRPVTIYRLATYGTTEHVVFAYALQKSWLQKKITDISDPRRQQRHQTRNYFRYPCQLALPDSTPPLTAEEEARLPTTQRARAYVLDRRRREAATELCREQCPPAAAVFVTPPYLELAHLYSVIPQAMLLRQDDDELIRDRARHFEEAAMRKRAAIAIPLQLQPASNANASRDHLSLIDACEPALADAARQAAHGLIAQVLHAEEEERRAMRPNSSLLAGDTTAEVRTTDAMLCRHLKPLVASVVEKRPEPQVLAEVLLCFYQAAVSKMANRILQGGEYLRLRTALTSRIPAANRHRPRDTALPARSPLEDALLLRPVSLLGAMSGQETTYMTTELGCDRPLVGWCMLRGLQELWMCEGKPVLDHATLQELSRLLGARPDSMVEDEEEEAGELSEGDSDGVPMEEGELLSQSVLEAVLGCLEEQWPAYESLILPPIPLNLLQEEINMERTYHAATAAHGQGLFTMAESAELLHLPQYSKGYHNYGCGRCPHVMLQRTDGTHLACPQCHYNAEFEMRAHAQTQQHATLYQLSVVANLLDAFSISCSFAVDFSPAGCADVSVALRAVHTSQAAFNFVRRIMDEGVKIFLTEYPPTLLRLLGLQMGTGADEVTLGRLLRANGRLAMHRGVREHLRQRLAVAFADFVYPSKLAALTAMPVMLLVSALYYLARHEQLTHTHELLLDEYPPPYKKLLRFASDALVKILYVERLLKNCREKPAPPPPPPTNSITTRSSPAAVRRGEAKHSDSGSDHSYTSLLMAASSSSSSSGSGGRASPNHCGPPGSASNQRDSAADSDEVSGDDDSSTGHLRNSSKSSSSFHSAYSSDRESFAEGSDSDADGDIVKAGLALDAAMDDQSTWLEALASDTLPTPAPTAEELESEAVQQQRSAQYWIAFCEVYGTHSAETLTVLIEDGKGGVKPLTPPPLSLWVAQAAHTTLVGTRVMDMLDLFLKKLLELAQQVRLIS